MEYISSFTAGAAENFSAAALSAGILACLGKYIVYILICVAILAALKALLPIPREVWRKSLHVIAFTSAPFMMQASGSWLISTLCFVIICIAAYPALHLAERWRGYDDLFIQRKTGEVKKSLLLLFGCHAVLILVFWGWLNTPWVVITAIFTWGVGDIAAALVGKNLGKHHVHLPLADRKKTWEGTAAMAAAAFITALVTLIIATDFSLPRCLLMALAAAPAAAYTELISHNGNDTVTVASTLAVLLWLLARV